MRSRAKPATVLTERWYPLFVWRGEGIHFMFGRAPGTDFRWMFDGILTPEALLGHPLGPRGVPLGPLKGKGGADCPLNVQLTPKFLEC